ncbi:hypothetical protein [Candidatus Marimicrobium litorale]|uniref:hypothetical protein n=1 Tax=Candidatus Marimicrobium litorale TaxID=2518991 RepID=UPI00242B241D|nr:hypothetical protein [Candidatus Marimicrobium litorale]
MSYDSVLSFSQSLHVVKDISVHAPSSIKTVVAIPGADVCMAKTVVATTVSIAFA